MFKATQRTTDFLVVTSLPPSLMSFTYNIGDDVFLFPLEFEELAATLLRMELRPIEVAQSTSSFFCLF